MIDIKVACLNDYGRWWRQYLIYTLIRLESGELAWQFVRVASNEEELYSKGIRITKEDFTQRSRPSSKEHDYSLRAFREGDL